VKFERPRNLVRLTPEQRRSIICEYVGYYKTIFETEPEKLSKKVPRNVFSDLLDTIGNYLLEESKVLSKNDPSILSFLEENALPSSLSQSLTPEYRVFCLALNALKQWIAAEQTATDKFILGANVRNEIRSSVDTCIVTGEKLSEVGCELHHTVRDGRPPIPLSPSGHEKVDGQTLKAATNPNLETIADIRSRNGQSWKQLRRGCLDLIGMQVEHSTHAVGSSARAFARKASIATNLSFEEILDLMDQFELGEA
jgi:hypothetical protein